MTSVVRKTSLKCIEWTLQTSNSASTYVSKRFSLQDCPCHLQLNLGDYYGYGTESYLHFKVNGKLQLPLKVIVHVANASDTIDHKEISIKNSNQAIWKYCANLTNSLFTIKVIVLNDPVKGSNDMQLLDSEFCLKSLSQDLVKMFRDEQDYDVEVKCEDRSWKVHKSILCARSKVLQRMLENDMKEKRTGVITIQDMDIPTVQYFLEYIYCGKLPEMSVETGKRCYEIGDRYDIECLKTSCSDYLVNHLSPENACEILVIADLHHDSRFKERVIDYMTDEKFVLNDSLWGDFKMCHPILAVEVYSQFCKIHCSK